MGNIGYRPKGESAPLYAPERDYAYITPTLMRTAIENLETDDPEIVEWRRQHGITGEVIAALAQSLAEAQRDFVNASDPVSSFEQALSRRDFFSLSFEARQFLFSTLGYVFCAAWFRAVREVSIIGEDSPAAADMARFSAAVAAFAKKQGAAVLPSESVAETLRLRIDVLNSRISYLVEKLNETTNELKVCQEQKSSLSQHKQQTGLLSRLWTVFESSRNA
jgi:hypothetical protein